MQCDLFFLEKKVRKGRLLRKSKDGEEMESVRRRMKIKLYREKERLFLLRDSLLLLTLPTNWQMTIKVAIY